VGEEETEQSGTLATTTVLFGSKAGTSLSVAVDGLSLTVKAPSGSGSVPVLVKTPFGSANAGTWFYIPPPVEQSLSSEAGPLTGGTTSIFGSGLATTTAVTFGTDVAPLVNAVSDGQVDVTTPTVVTPGTLTVKVTSAGGTTSGLLYTFVDEPTFISITPAEGPVDGGPAATILGTNLGSTQSVTFGTLGVDDVPGASYVISDSQVGVTPPPGAGAGAVDINITTLADTITVTDGWLYGAPPG
jgi:hypothetical protein